MLVSHLFLDILHEFVKWILSVFVDSICHYFFFLFNSLGPLCCINIWWLTLSSVTTGGSETLFLAENCAPLVSHQSCDLLASISQPLKVKSAPRALPFQSLLCWVLLLNADKVHGRLRSLSCLIILASSHQKVNPLKGCPHISISTSVHGSMAGFLMHMLPVKLGFCFRIKSCFTLNAKKRICRSYFSACDWLQWHFVYAGYLLCPKEPGLAGPCIPAFHHWCKVLAITFFVIWWWFGFTNDSQTAPLVYLYLWGNTW